MTTLVFDFDGVLSEGPEYHWPLTGTDFDLIREAQARGYAVAVSTCNTVAMVASALESAGIRCYADTEREHGSWQQRDVVLVTDRKVSGVMVDDRAVSYRYGQRRDLLWADVDASERARRRALMRPAPVRPEWIYGER